MFYVMTKSELFLSEAIVFARVVCRCRMSGIEGDGSMAMGARSQIDIGVSPSLSFVERLHTSRVFYLFFS